MHGAGLPGTSPGPLPARGRGVLKRKWGRSQDALGVALRIKYGTGGSERALHQPKLLRSRGPWRRTHFGRQASLPDIYF